MRRFATQICVVLLLSGCDKAASLCAADSSKSSAISLVRDQINKAIRSQLSSADPNANDVVTPSSIRSALNQLAFSLDNIRTAEADPNSTKRHCDADISIIFPVDIFNKANEARRSLNQNTISDLADKSDLKVDADKFTGPIAYSVQPTDDKKSTYTEMQADSPFTKFVIEVTANSLMSDTITRVQQQQKAASDQQAAEDAASLASKRAADLNMAKVDNRMAIQVIGAVWGSIPHDTRMQLLPLQRAWLDKTRADCRVQAASASTDPTEIQTAETTCETTANRDRAEELKRYQPQGFAQPFGQNDPSAAPQQ